MTGADTASAPRIFTVPAGRPLADAVAAEVLGPRLAAVAADRLLLLLPTRRACLAMREALLRQSGGRPLLAPRILPIGDLDPDGDGLDGDLGWAEAGLPDLPPAIAPLRRQLLLAAQIRARKDLPVSAAQALKLAAALARLIDLAHTERVGFDRLAELVPDRLADHWQRTLDFLAIVTETWPQILKAEAALDPADRRDRMLAALARAWGERPPEVPVWVVGSTGSIPATAELMAAVARLPQGRVVLPGLDRELDDESWQGLDDSHPQAGLKRLLETLRIARADVADWPLPPRPRDLPPPPDRSRLIREAMRPPATTDAWRDIAGISKHDLAGLTRLDCATDREEAAAIAVAMRQVLDDKGRTCALITADRTLARRVEAALGAWRIEVDDSAGRPLGRTGVGSFLRLVADAAAARVSPVALLALLKHPLCGVLQGRADLARRVRRLDVALRGPRPAPGFDGLRRAVLEAGANGQADREVVDLLYRLDLGLRPLTEALAGGAAPAADLVRAHLKAAEWLAGDDQQPGHERLWRGDDGEQAARLFAELLEAADGLPPQAPADYPLWVAELLAQEMVRPSHGAHPRLFLWGTLEARLQSADLVILGGLNEGTWPADPPVDPWMSRPMRAGFGLSPPDRRVGLAAHDFTQALASRRVLLTRAERVAGTPTVASHWLLRLDAVLARCGLLWDRATELRDWAAALETPAGSTARAAPAPCPPQAARPRRLRVTEIGDLLADPYRIYARHVLDLRPLDPLDADPGAAERGNAVHDALAWFLQQQIDPRAPDALERLLVLGRRAFGRSLDDPRVAALWWPRFSAVAAWVIARQAERSGRAVPLAAEVAGAALVGRPPGADGADRGLTLVCRVDRIDRLADGTLEIIDYKTGTVPSGKQIAFGFQPQLPLEAALALRGAFAGVPVPDAPPRLAYWRLAGGDPAGEEIVRKELADPGAAAAAWAGMADLVARFDRADMPYRARPTPDFVPKGTDYDHLERVTEWSAGGGDGETGP
ncbi:MAG: double-strand break repair protein AddB [Rhodospirillaceae bacterium]|nr:double-strand break repair protein AddB [Rhodospirillaceae bacterium]